MNIAILVPTLSVGGAEKIAIETARGLANQNNAVYLFVISKKNTFFPVEDKVHVVYLNGFNKIFQFYKLLKLYKIEKCISYLERANLLGLISCSLAKVDLCATVHTAPKSAFRNRPLINRIFIYITYKLISIMKHKVICVSQGIKDDLYDLYGIENSIVIPNFVNLSDVPKRNNSGEVLYDYIFVGRIEPVKGCDILVEAFLSISDWVLKENVRIAIVGDGTDLDKIKSKIINSNISSNFTFFGKVGNPLKIMSESDTIIVPSYAEGFGLVVIEALLSGLKVIYSKCEFGPKEIIGSNFPEYNKLGFISPLENEKKSIKELALLIKESRKIERIPHEQVLGIIFREYSQSVVCRKIASWIKDR